MCIHFYSSMFMNIWEGLGIEKLFNVKDRSHTCINLVGLSLSPSAHLSRYTWTLGPVHAVVLAVSGRRR